MKRLLLFAIILSLLGACNDDDKTSFGNGPALTLTTSMEAFTSSDIPDGLKLTWPSDANMGVFEFDVKKSLFTNSNRRFNLSQGEGSSIGIFTGTAQSSDGWSGGEKILYGYYPYDAANNTASAIPFSIPDVQTQVVDAPLAHVVTESIMTTIKEFSGGNSEGASLTLEAMTTVIQFGLTNNTNDALQINKLVLRSDGSSFYKSGIYSFRDDILTFTDSDKIVSMTVQPDETVVLAVGDKITFSIVAFPLTIPRGGELIIELYTDRDKVPQITQAVTDPAGLSFEAGKLYYTDVTITERTFLTPETVRLPEGQNSFIVNPATNGMETLLQLPLTRVNEYWTGIDNSKTIGANDAWVAEIIWKDFDLTGTGSVISFTNGINNGVGPDSRISLSLNGYPDDQYGNVVIGIKKADSGGQPAGDWLWSWHLWITDFDEAIHSLTYAGSGAKTMDRNLGAKNNTKGDAGALGLLYQWGRKDPFVGAASTTGTVRAETTITWPDAVPASTGGTHSYAVQNPTTFILCNTTTPIGDWLTTESASAWSNNAKTIHDPCPKGWKVASRNSWSDFAPGTTFVFDTDNKGYLYNSKDWYPMSGRLNHLTGALENVGTTGYYPSSGSATRTMSAGNGNLSDPAGLNYVARALYFTPSALSVDDNNNVRRANGNPVRCIRYTNDD